MADVRAVAESGWSWVLDQVDHDHDGPWLPASVSRTGVMSAVDPVERDGVYSGLGGLALALREVQFTRQWTEREEALARDIVERLAHRAAARDEPSLYVGLAGDVTALRVLAPGRESVALQRLADVGGDSGWVSTEFPEPVVVNDLLLGTAGVVLAALWADGPLSEQIATTGADALLAAADPTPTGLDWPVEAGYPTRMPNFSHGTAGVASALALAGARFARADFLDAARRGAEHLLAIGDHSDGGLRVPHYVPPGGDEEPFTYSWCHGPTGTSYLFLALAAAGMAEVGGRSPEQWYARCLQAVRTSGVPQRLRPGFWDNDGRCCGTAGVGDVFLDHAQRAAGSASGEGSLGFADVLGSAVLERATTDSDGTRWHFLEHRNDSPELDAGTGWMQGAAGIAAFLFRLARVKESGPAAPVVDRPDSWWAVPEPTRAARTPRH